MYHSHEEIPDVSFIEADAFVGPMISKRAVEDVGIANGGLFTVSYTHLDVYKRQIQGRGAATYSMSPRSPSRSP